MTACFLKDIADLKYFKSCRESSWDRTGDNYDFITVPSKTTKLIANIKGTGYITHVYITVKSADRHIFRKALIKMYWDGETTPSVEVPLGDFFGIVHCRPAFFSSLLLSVTPWYIPGMNCYFPMPFENSAKIEIENQSEEPISALYYHIDYELHDSISKNAGRFHAYWNRENPTNAVPPLGKEHRYGGSKNIGGKENYVILNTEGDGAILGLILGVDNLEEGWWGEGDDMIFINGEKWPPSIHGTGTEELFGLAYCPTYEFTTPYCGFQLVGKPNWKGKMAAYRFFVPDPIRFKKNIKMTIEHGHANNLSNDYTSTVYWYQKEPHMPFPAMLPVEARIPRESEYYWKKIVPLEKEMWQIFDEQGRQKIRWQKYPSSDQWIIRCLIDKLNRAYVQDDYRKMGIYFKKIIKIMKKYG